MKNSEHILIIHPAGLGDGILSLPAIYSLRQAYPQARITLIGYPERWEWLSPAWIQQVVSIEQYPLYRLFEQGADISENLNKLLRRQDLIVSWFGDEIFLKNLQRCTSAQIIFAPFRPEKLTGHAAQFFLHTLSPLKIPLPGELPDLPVNDSDTAETGAFLQNSRKPQIVIHPGSGSRKKCWDPQKFARVISTIEKDWLGTVWLIIGEADEWLLPELSAHLKELSEKIVRQQPLNQVAVLLKQCSAYLGNDSGISHLAGVLGVPTLVLFGATDPNIWRPQGNNVRVFQRPFSELTVSEVMEELATFLR